ncbi:uncharacterized protein LOC114269214 isoform X2 [Camellia sinensis]|nr:uncharacterized protein LOC114269214 isoform X2 [Camellia sinensis]XP_028066295.1 uncharacterized protein LOC114269214 isoform X2 [Camellia sinensis]
MNVRAFTANESSGQNPSIRGSYLGVIEMFGNLVPHLGHKYLGYIHASELSRLIISDNSLCYLSWSNNTCRVFSLISLQDMIRNASALSRTTPKPHEGTHFLIYHANHWTVMVLDVETRTWKHYNSMRQRQGMQDDHYNKALKMKQWVVDHHTSFMNQGWKPTMFRVKIGRIATFMVISTQQ